GPNTASYGSLAKQSFRSHRSTAASSALPPLNSKLSDHSYRMTALSPLQKCQNLAAYARSANLAAEAKEISMLGKWRSCPSRKKPQP
ncbi:hypothetical protein, partial [uncultured Roseovarius sp.]|uniref:hypothetical protein n=1 Tax=uncultured Roseovarius sp. TaxID=293344 RepID=UPI002627DB36